MIPRSVHSPYYQEKGNEKDLDQGQKAMLEWPFLLLKVHVLCGLVHPENKAGGAEGNQGLLSG